MGEKIYRSVVLDSNDLRVLKEWNINISGFCREMVHRKALELLEFEEKVEREKLDFDIP
ncbi:hypothetical protein J7K19_02110 [bacterium]|nr:hypothetical protein [bacterium]